MENEKKTFEEDSWFDSLLNPTEGQQEIVADEQALSGAGLSRLSDMELEKILKEALEAPTPQPQEQEASVPQKEAEPELLPESAEPEKATEPQAPVPAESPEAEDCPERKVRPKRKKGYGLFGLPHLAATAIWLLIAVTIGVSLGRLLWVCASDVLAFGREDQAISITITKEDTLDTVTEKLYNAGLIKYKELFKMYAKLAKVEEKEKISAGTFTLNKLYDYHALVGAMSYNSADRQIVEDVMIPEGYTCAQIFALLEEKGVCSAKDLEEYAANGELNEYWFLEDLPRGDKYCLEGYLFPDTYDFYSNDTPKRVLHKLLNRFEDQFSDDLRAQVDSLNQILTQKMESFGYDQDYIEQNLFTAHEVVIVASMIEKESAHSGESQEIAAVIYNRLCNRREFKYLNIDATIVYALGGKTDLTPEDLKVDHPYNTYNHEGLPPGPISNPGLLSLKCALQPSDDNYYYYALDPSLGEHHFSRTYEEHLKFLDSLKG